MVGTVRTARPETGAAFVVRVDPENGASGVLSDSPVLLRLSRPVDPESISSGSLQVRDRTGAVPGRVDLSPDGLVVIWWPRQALAGDVEHVVVASGLRARGGGGVEPHTSRFRTCGLRGVDLMELVSV